ncbi:MAG: hypothetical protein P8Y45_04820 [Exilibacterium sp.]
MAWISAALPYIQAAGAAVGVGATIAQGNVQEQMGALQAKQLREQALADQAESQLLATEERKRAAFLSSRVQALASASGSGLDSPNIVNTLADIDEKGAYNALAALYSGQTSARSKNLAADMAGLEGRTKKRGSRAKAAGTIISSGQSLYDRYG